MRWFRSNTNLGGRSALFALAVQLALSFGHVHRDGLYAVSPGAGPALSSASQSGSSPSNQPVNHGDDYCAICATIALIGSSLVAAAPMLPLPRLGETVAPVGRVAGLVVAQHRTAFQSRAPPAA